MHRSATFVHKYMDMTEGSRWNKRHIIYTHHINDRTFSDFRSSFQIFGITSMWASSLVDRSAVGAKAEGVILTTNEDVSYNEDAVAIRRRWSFIFELIVKLLAVSLNQWCCCLGRCSAVGLSYGGGNLIFKRILTGDSVLKWWLFVLIPTYVPAIRSFISFANPSLHDIFCHSFRECILFRPWMAMGTTSALLCSGTGNWEGKGCRSSVVVVEVRRI